MSVRNVRSKQSRLKMMNRRKARHARTFLPKVETLEDRRVMAAGVLQGFSYIDMNANGQLDPIDTRQAGTTVQLLSASNTLLASTTTNADGYYRFDGLASGTYRVKEIVPLGFAGDVQIDNVFSQASVVGPPENLAIEVVVHEPADAAWSGLQINRQENPQSNPNFPGVNSAFSLLGGPGGPGPFNPFSSVPDETNAHQYALNLAQPGGVLPSNPSATFYSFCADLYHAYLTRDAIFDVAPSVTPASRELPANVGRIGYLYNEFGRRLLSETQGTALQLAIYELLYDATPDMAAGNFVVDPANTDPVAYAAANSYLSLSAGKNESVVFLNIPEPNAADTVDPFVVTNRQGMIVSENFNFPNMAPSGAALIDLSVTKSVDNPAPAIDANVTFTITVSNAPGYATATGVSVQDALPAGMTYVSDDSAGSYNSGTGIWTVGALLGGGSKTLHITAQATAAALPSVANTAEVIAADAPDFDSTPNNQIAAEDDQATVTVTPIAPPPAGKLSGYVFKDANNNGVKNSGEVGLAGVVVNLTGTDDQGNPVSQTQTTAADGLYAFLGVAAGTYKITEVQPGNYLDGKDAVGSLGGVLSDDVISSIALAAGADGTGYNFGELGKSKLSGYVYLDLDNDGKREAGEAGIQGVKITLIGFTDECLVYHTAYTDGNGYYEFTNLRPGIYALAESQSRYYADGKETLGTINGVTSGIALNDLFIVCLTEDDLGLNYNFGERRKC